MGFKNAHTRAGFFEKLRKQGKYKENTPAALPKIISAPKISIPKAPSIAAPSIPKIANTNALMNLAKPQPNLMNNPMPTAPPITNDAAPGINDLPDQPHRFKKLKRLF